MSVWKKLLRKAEGDEQNPLAGLEGLDDDQKEAIAQLLAAKDEQIAQLQQAKAEETEEEKEDESEEEEQKADDEDEKEANNKAMAKARAEVAELRKALDTERNLRLDREYLEKARSYSAIPMPAEKIGGLLRAVAEKAKDQAPVLEQVLKACDTLAREGGAITKSLGVANGSGGGGSVAVEVDEAAAALLKADPKLSKAEAVAKAWTPERIKRHREETARA